MEEALGRRGRFVCVGVYVGVSEWWRLCVGIDVIILTSLLSPN